MVVPAGLYNAGRAAQSAGVREERTMTAEENSTQEQAPAGGRDPWVRVTLEAPRPLPLPSETRQHLLNAKREVLLALRSLVDTAIERTDAQAEGRADRRRSRIEIDEE